MRESEICARGVELQTVYENQNRLAELTEELKTVEIEQKHFPSVINDGNFPATVLPKELPSDMILRICQELDAYLNGESKMGFFGKLCFRFTYDFSFKFFTDKEKETSIPGLQMRYYRKKLPEIHDEMNYLQEALKDVDADKLSQQ